MSANTSKLLKKSYLLLPVVVLVLMCAILFVVNSRTEPNSVLASENEKADANKPAADANDEKDQDAEESKAARPEHAHPAFKERVRDREKMVARQIQGRGVSDPNVLLSLRAVPRHEFVRPSDSGRAYRDSPLPIGLGQTISQPYIVGYMTEALKLDPNSRVFEVGTGSGYQAAVCAEIAREVYTAEIIETLAESAKKRLKELGYANVSVKAGDGYYGWEEKAPFDAIIVTAAAGLVPPPLVEQLKPGGRMILPLGSPFGQQRLVLITKDEKGTLRSRSVLPVMFVPMVGRVRE